MTNTLRFNRASSPIRIPMLSSECLLVTFIKQAKKHRRWRLPGILTAIYHKPSAQTLLALEESESSLHPGALAVLSDGLLEASRQRQVLVTTQSPDLISRFSADQLLVVERTGRVTSVGEIDETQRSSIEESLFSASDLLRIEGLRRTER